MNILAIETSTPHASVCLMQQAATPAATSRSHAWEAERNHDAHLFPALAQTLEQLGTSPLDLILVGAGPGSYGGVRVALAAADGIALVRQTPVAALCSWSCFAMPEEETWIVSDAKRGGWTFARYAGNGCPGDIGVLTLDELLTRLEHRPARVLSTETAEHLTAKGLTCIQGGSIPTAEQLILAWLALAPEKRQQHLTQPPAPIYVRPPHITEAKRKPWESRKQYPFAEK